MECPKCHKEVAAITTKCICFECRIHELEEACKEIIALDDGGHYDFDDMSAELGIAIAKIRAVMDSK